MGKLRGVHVIIRLFSRVSRLSRPTVREHYTVFWIQSLNYRYLKAHTDGLIGLRLL